jgi:uncharacterized cupin superfamily protein
MKRVNQNELPWVERTSPKGKFRKFRRDLSRALATEPASPPLPGHAPFEVELMRLPAGTANYPFHSHSAEWECYLILSGTGTMRAGDGRSPLAPGDCVMCPPGEPHQIVNDGDSDLLFYVIANNTPSDVWHYPDSDKWGFALPNGDSVYFRKSDVDYYDREE